MSGPARRRHSRRRPESAPCAWVGTPQSHRKTPEKMETRPILGYMASRVEHVSRRRVTLGCVRAPPRVRRRPAASSGRPGRRAGSTYLGRTESLHDASARAREKFFEALSSTSERIRRRRNSTWNSSSAASGVGRVLFSNECAVDSGIEAVKSERRETPSVSASVRRRAHSETRRADDRVSAVATDRSRQTSKHSVPRVRVSRVESENGRVWTDSSRRYCSLPRPRSPNLHPPIDSIDFTGAEPIYDTPSSRLVRRVSRNDLTFEPGQPEVTDIAEDMPGRVSNIPVYRRRPASAAADVAPACAGARAQKTSDEPRSRRAGAAASAVPAAVASGCAGGGGTGTAAAQRSARPATNAKLMTYTSLPRAKIEYCPEPESGSSRTSVRGPGGPTEERCPSPKPPIHPGAGKSRPGAKTAGASRRAGAGTASLRHSSPAGRDTEPATSVRTKTVAHTENRRPGLTIDTRNKQSRREMSASPRPAADGGTRPGRGAPSPGSSARSTPSSCPISPQSSLSPNSPRHSPRTFRFSGPKYASGIPTRRSTGADSVGGTESPTSGSSINLSDISGLSTLTSPESSTNGAPMQPTTSRSGRKLQKPIEQQPVARNGAATAAHVSSKNTSKTWIGTERGGGRVGSPLCRSQESVVSGVESDGAPASRTASQNSLHEPGRVRRLRATPARVEPGKFGSRSITTIRARNLSKGSSGEREKENQPRLAAGNKVEKLTDATSTKTANKNASSTAHDTRSKAGTVTVKAGPATETPQSKAKVKVQRSLSLQSAAKPNLPPKPSHLRPPAALGTNRSDPLTSLPNIQGLGTDTWRPTDDDTWQARAKHQHGSSTRSETVPGLCGRSGPAATRRAGRGVPRHAPDNNRAGRSGDAIPFVPLSDRHSSAAERRRRADTSNVPTHKNHQRPASRGDRTFQAGSERQTGRRHINGIESTQNPTLEPEPEPKPRAEPERVSRREPESEPERERERESTRPQYGAGSDSRWSSSGTNSASISGRDTDSCSESGSICLPVPSPARKHSVEKAVYSSVIHVNGAEDGLVTNQTRLQRSVDAGQQVQATIQGQKDAHNDNKVRLSLNVDGDFLNNQFDAIIETLKQVAASVQEQGSRPGSVAMTPRGSDPIYAEIRSPRAPAAALSPEPIYSEIRPPVPVRAPGAPPVTEAPTTPPPPPPLPPAATPRTQAENDAFFDSSPTLDELARKLHADARHLNDDCDYVNFHDLESPYRTPPPPAPQAGQLVAGRRGGESDPHAEITSLPYSRNLESVQECSENSSRPDSRDGPASFERLQRETKKALSRSLSDKGAAPRPALSVFRAGSECGDDSARFGTRSEIGARGEFGAPRSERSSCQYLDSDGSVFSSTSDVWTGRHLENAMNTLAGGGLGKTRTHSTGSEAGGEPRRHKVKEATSSSFLSRDSKLRGLVRNGWRGARRSHSSSDDCRDSTITIDDFIASLYGQQGVSLEALGPCAPRETVDRGESERRAPLASTASTAAPLGRGRSTRSNSITTIEPAAGSRGRLTGNERPEEEAGSGRDSPVPQQRSLSLPKTFLAERYGLAGIKAAIPR